MDGGGDKTMDNLVAQYLKQRGFAKTEELLREELGASSLEEYAGRAVLDQHTNVLRTLLNNDLTQTSPDWYIESYRYLRRWIDTSLDLYKSELQGILFPVFMHCYLELVLKGFVQPASTFLEEHRNEHRVMHAKEVDAVTGLWHASDVASNEIARRYRDLRVDVQLSCYAHQLLITFLQEYKLYALLKIVNEHINLNIVSATSTTPIQPGSNLRPATGIDVQQLSSINEGDIQWGALREMVTLEQESNIPESVQALKDKKGLNSRVPLPKLTKERRSKIMLEMSKRTHIAKESLPSVCFYSFLNCGKMLNSCEISSTGKFAAAGLTDSTIKVWDMGIKEKGENESFSLVGHSSAVYGLDFCPDEQFLLSSGADYSIRLWMMSDRMNLVAYKGHNAPVWDVKFASVGYYFASASS